MQYLIMHGSFGSPNENWFRWLESKLKKEGHEVILEQFPVDDWNMVSNLGQEKIQTYQCKESLTSWEKYFIDHIIERISMTPTSFIGHSIAPVFMLHMLNKYDFHLNKAVFVAPFFNIPDRPEIWQFYPVNKTFYSDQFNFTKIKSQISQSFVVYGDDDPYVPITEPIRFAEKLEANVCLVKGGKHCGSNFKEFPLVFDLLNEVN